MTHIGLICPAASGHLNPMTSLGYALKQRGHRVTLVGIPDGMPQAEAAGLEFQAIGEREFPAGSNVVFFDRLGKLSGLAASRYTVQLFTQLTATLLQELPSAVKAADLELLLIDQNSFGGPSVAQSLDLPYISVACALMLNPDPNVPPFITSWRYHPATWARLRNQWSHHLLSRWIRPIQSLIADYRQQWNLPLNPREDFSPFAQLCQEPAEFEFPRQHLPACFHFTGPYASRASRATVEFPFDRLTNQPLIYASLGTLQNRLLHLFEAIAAACQGLAVQLVIALGGGASPEDLPPLPGQPIVVGYAPQLELLERATLTITHAGMNTTLESLSCGVPMVALPITNDQPGVAARIAWTGTGEVVPIKQLTVAKLRAAIVKVLGDPSYRDNARRLQNAIQRAGGLERAADIVEQVIQTQKPVLAAPSAAASAPLPPNGRGSNR
ncbi:glycosyltransferase [Lyngbya confervoides]|uniref:Glycosyltransferase n=1 Tax=Lyngbya confervoides BDU141951 TaxID=1574623 RepID=A0ABD4T6E7_9CYAN|nr:glycosyltransferase [Lyngbya confervoides]MCM1984060.1 glycosyltransferase [Lyngbya confervoides BDU141951]